MTETKKSPRFHQALRQDERVRLVPGGPLLRVVRVTKGAAYLRSTVTRQVEIAGRSFLATSSETIPVSVHAAVYRDEMSA